MANEYFVTTYFDPETQYKNNNLTTIFLKLVMKFHLFYTLKLGYGLITKNIRMSILIFLVAILDCFEYL